MFFGNELAARKRAGLKPAPTFFCVPCVLCGFFVFFAAFAVKFAALGPPSWSKLFTGHISKSNRRPISNAAVFFFFSDGPETLPELALLGAELLGHANVHAEEQISSPFPPNSGRPFPLSRSTLFGWVPGGTVTLTRPLSVGTSRLSSQHGVGNWNLLSMPEIRAVTLKACIRRGLYHDKEIPCARRRHHGSATRAQERAAPFLPRLPLEC